MFIGRGEVSMRVEVDFTKMRKGSKPRGRKIDYCPICGKKGEYTNYKKNNYSIFIHKGFSNGLFFDVADYCSVQDGE